jgi:hypothetical protein
VGEGACDASGEGVERGSVRELQNFARRKKLSAEFYVLMHRRPKEEARRADLYGNSLMELWRQR